MGILASNAEAVKADAVRKKRDAQRAIQAAAKGGSMSAEEAQEAREAVKAMNKSMCRMYVSYAFAYAACTAYLVDSGQAWSRTLNP